MLAGWRHDSGNALLSSGNLLALAIALESPTAAGIGLAAGLVSITSLFAWHVNLRRYSAVADTPTSRIASAPQGYVEIVGKGVHPPGDRLISPNSGLPCLWYHYIIEEKSGSKWHRIGEDISTATFGIDDGTGLALIDRDAAEIITSHKHVTTNGHYRHTEWSLIAGETLYVLGEHAAIGGASAVPDFKGDVSGLLADWKRDQAGLLRRFDLNGDDSISLEEWELARKAAKQQVGDEHRKARLHPTTHLLRKPAGRLYLIANRAPAQLAARYRFWAWTHLGLAIGACITAASLL